MWNINWVIFPKKKFSHQIQIKENYKEEINSSNCLEPNIPSNCEIEDTSWSTGKIKPKWEQWIAKNQSGRDIINEENQIITSEWREFSLSLSKQLMLIPHRHTDKLVQQRQQQQHHKRQQPQLQHQQVNNPAEISVVRIQIKWVPINTLFKF